MKSATIHQPNQRCLVFSLGKSNYGINACDALQIVRNDSLVVVPGASPTIAGALAYRQEVFGILRLSKVLNVEASGESWIILLRQPDRRVGILVSEIMRMGRVRDQLSLSVKRDGALTIDMITEQGTLPFLDVEELFRQF